MSLWLSGESSIVPGAWQDVEEYVLSDSVVGKWRRNSGKYFAPANSVSCLELQRYHARPLL